MYSPGDCIFIVTNQYKDGTPKAHLFVVVLEATQNNHRTILLPFCRIPEKGYYDSTKTFSPGDHDFITYHTYIDYRLGRVIRKDQLDTLIKTRAARLRKPRLSNKQLQKAIDGILKSPHTTYEIRSEYEDYLYSLL